ncbi:hypothetical protein E4L96_00585 [Massilia arenosa]|uniref:DUF4231 domain-containing protein n=1 Tax=Zemynaea arenosa TaxID=2561931 RepID=A0A4Y9SY53_9BURK|nr:hypothetical protein [Massilia arenosa]TFW30144.1 hypothetical protein E4L96_00585 [Massilia arenosa]
MPSLDIRCRSAGRIRNFFRKRLLLAGWQARELPAAPSQESSQSLLEKLTGRVLLQRVTSALHEADTLAQRIGGCARDAYTVLYGCAALAVLLAAWGVASTSPSVKLMLAVAELGTLIVLFLTYRNAHSVNWHERWLGLRFHAEFLRCLPVLVALNHDRSPLWLHGRSQADLRDDHAVLPPHLAALAGHHHASEDARAAAHERAQHEVRTQLLGQMEGICRDDEWTYTWTALEYARQLARQQLRYHCRRAQEEQLIMHRVHAISLVSFAATIAAVMAHMVWHAAFLTMISTGVPAFAASLQGFTAQEESERLVASSSSMAHRLDAWLNTGVDADAELAEVQEHLSNLVELLMSEVHDWHRLFGEKGLYHLG